MCSVDGRTLSENWGNPKGRKAYEPIGEKYKGTAWMSGRVTMQKDFAGNKRLKLKTSGNIPRTDHVANAGARSFAIAIDKDGKLPWTKSEIDGDHIIAVLSEKVSAPYLAHLQQKGISYIFGGKKDIDFELVLQKLASLFGIKKIMLEGGGHLNGSFLQAGLIDELSLLYLPVADGSADTPSLFDIPTKLPKGSAVRLKLLGVKKLENDVIWMKYKVSGLQKKNLTN